MSIPYKLTRAKRKTLSIYVRPDETVEVKAPFFVTEKKINAFVSEKEAWILEHLEQIKQHNVQKKAFFVDYGQCVLLRGQEYPITAAKTNRVRFDGQFVCIPESLAGEEIKKAVIILYRKYAAEHLKERTMHYARLMDVAPQKVSVTSAKTRWGSCASTGRINFSWRLIQADDSAIDYVVVHELAHLKEHNHSAKFWGEVAKVIPDYKHQKEKLKQLQVRLNHENWEDNK